MPLTRPVPPAADFAAVFQQSPRKQMLLDPSFIILAVTDAYAAATMTEPGGIIGHFLFEIFPDNPNHSSADGVQHLKDSLVTVLRTRAAHEMAVQRYDVRRPMSGFEERHWKPVNAPILDDKGFVRYILHDVEDVTAQVRK